jgi:predicted PurR-regulated permease PerM
MKLPSDTPEREPLETISPRTTTAVIVAVVVFLYFVRAILLPFILPAAVAYVCTPLVEWLAQHTRIRRGAAAGAVFLVLLATLAALGYFAAPPFLRGALHLVTDLRGTIETAAHRAIGDRTVQILGQSMNAAQISQRAVQGLGSSLSQGRALALAAWGFAGVFSIFLMIVLLFYFLVGGPQISQGLFWLVPPKQRPLIHSIWRRLDPVLKRYFIGVAAVVVYASSASYVGIGLVLKLPHAILLALLTGILEMLPVIGPALSAIIAGLVAIQNATSLGGVVGYAIYATALRLSIDQLLGPLVLGSAARIHPTLIIFCFLTGGLLFGVVGVILAVPVALTIKIVLATLYEELPDDEAARREITS